MIPVVAERPLRLQKLSSNFDDAHFGSKPEVGSKDNSIWWSTRSHDDMDAVSEAALFPTNATVPSNNLPAVSARRCALWQD
jgi:hypothetical protein